MNTAQLAIALNQAANDLAGNVHGFRPCDVSVLMADNRVYVTDRTSGAEYYFAAVGNGSYHAKHASGLVSGLAEMVVGHGRRILGMI